MDMERIGFGGGCHWCTEAVFQSLKGVEHVEQGFIKSRPPADTWSEAVIVTFDPTIIELAVLIEIHLRTHASTSHHKMRGKYRSATYTFDDNQQIASQIELSRLQSDFEKEIVTNVLPFVAFKESDERFHNYYQSDPERPFCKTYIDPKLTKLRTLYSDKMRALDGENVLPERRLTFYSDHMVYTIRHFGRALMPWKECKPMDERLRFIARLLDGEKMSPLCREFGISRMTGYKIYDRYKECGLDGLNDRSRRPYRQANKLPFQIERCILGIKQEHASWGAPKIRDKLLRTFPMTRPPAISTVHAVLDRHGLVRRRKCRRYKAEGTPLSATTDANGLWCADDKGEFKLSNKQYCYPLTITDYRSRYLLACEGLTSTKSDFAFAVFERVFKEYGLPRAIRTDNGSPFASPQALFGLSKLSVWGLRLGIAIERIRPGCPQQNGRHERMHLTLKQETAKPAAFNFLQQQECFDRFSGVYNNERPHQALGGAYPGDLYTPSGRVYEPPREPEYPFHDRTVRVTRCGRICVGKRKINLSQVFAGQTLGIREVDDQIWLVSFMHYDLGFFDKNENRVEPAANPFAPEKL